MRTHEEIFVVARELPVGEREAYLAEACGSVEQRGRVEELLREAGEAESFFEGLEPSPAPGVGEVAERPGDVVGRYKLLERIGEGGFGVVFMAEQREPVVRRVALKVIKPGLETREVVGRFEAERQALAMMDHSGIARVYDAGTTASGRPYFVMELVRGVPITVFCDQMAYDGSRRLGLFMDVCAAVQHAHQKGIIHRDLKPSNIIVGLDGDEPVVKIIDFGIAKATQQRLTDKTLFTRFTQFLGTPLYISPEQASLSVLDIDTRSDIYSLGVLLYELLTGKPPLAAEKLMAAGFDEMRRMIQECEAPRPSLRLTTVDEEEVAGIAKARQTEPRRLGLFIRGELDWIVLKALEKDRRRRYQTAMALREDVGRFLRKEPVSAAAPSRLYQVRKWVNRHRGLAASVAVCVVFLLGAVGVSTRQAVRALRAEEVARGSLEAVEQERDERERARVEAEELAGFLAGVFRSPHPDRDGRTVTVVERLDAAAGRLETGFDGRPDRKAGLRHALGATYLALGLYEEAIGMLESAYEHYRAEEGAGGPGTAVVMGELALSYRYAGRSGEALALQEELLLLHRSRDGEDDPRTLAAMQNLAISYDDHGRREEAMELREKGLRLARRVFGDDAMPTLRAMQNLAISLDHGGDHGGALELREEVFRKLRAMHGPDHGETIRAMANLAISYDHGGRHGEALVLREGGLEGSRRVRGAGHPETLSLMEGLAGSYERGGREEAARLLRAEVADRRLLARRGDPEDSLAVMARMAATCEAGGRGEEAAALREEVARRAELELPGNPGALGSEDVDVLNVRLEYRVAYGRWEDAAADARRLHELQPGSFRLLQLGALLWRGGDREGWGRLCREALSGVGEGAGAQEREHVAKVCLFFPEEVVERELVRREAVRAREELGGDRYFRSWVYLTEGWAAVRSNEFGAGLEAFRESRESPLAPEGRALEWALRSMAEEGKGLGEEAEASREEAAVLLGDYFGQPTGSRQEMPCKQWHDWLIARCAYEEACGIGRER